MFALDAMNLRAGDASSGVIAAFLLTVRRHGHKVLPFWRALFSHAGEKRDGGMDGVQALHELIVSRKGRNAGGSGCVDMAARAVNAVERWLRHEILQIVPRPFNLEGYLVQTAAADRLIRSK